MTTSNFWKFVVNPYHRIAGWEAASSGLAILLIATLTGKYSSTVFDGAIDLHVVQHTDFSFAFGSMTIGIVSLIVIMSLAGYIVAKGFRFIDMAGTILLAKAPLLLASLASFLTTVPNPDEIQKNPSILVESSSFLLVTFLLILPLSIWSIVLLFNAFKTVTGVKGSKLTAAFIVGIIVAEAISITLKTMIFR